MASEGEEVLEGEEVSEGEKASEGEALEGEAPRDVEVRMATNAAANVSQVVPGNDEAKGTPGGQHQQVQAGTVTRARAQGEAHTSPVLEAARAASAAPPCSHSAAAA